MLVWAVERRKLILRVRGTVIKVCNGVLCLSSLSMAALVSLDSCMGQPLLDAVVCVQSSHHVRSYLRFIILPLVLVMSRLLTFCTAGIS